MDPKELFNHKPLLIDTFIVLNGKVNKNVGAIYRCINPFQAVLYKAIGKTGYL